MDNGLDDLSLFELFRMEAEEQVHVLQTELIQLESGTATTATLEALMRASHSLKGAARTHAMEDRFVQAQAGHTPDSAEIDHMLTATDWLARLQSTAEAETAAWLEAHTPAIEAFAATLSDPHGSIAKPPIASPSAQPIPHEPAATEPTSTEPAPHMLGRAHGASELDEDIFGQRSTNEPHGRERTVRIASDRFDQLLSLSSETLIASRQLAAHEESLERDHRALAKALLTLEEDATASPARLAAQREMERQIANLAAHIAELDLTCRANERSTEQLYRTVLSGRLRPFSEGILGATRLVRDTARGLDKSVLLEVVGENTRVDRDILERLEAPIS
jgi:two-component system, chemotaxis family, sensor histidine kinase and response regulator WspE